MIICLSVSGKGGLHPSSSVLVKKAWHCASQEMYEGGVAFLTANPGEGGRASEPVRSDERGVAFVLCT